MSNIVQKGSSCVSRTRPESCTWNGTIGNADAVVVMGADAGTAEGVPNGLLDGAAVGNVAGSGDILGDTSTAPGDINFDNEPLGEGDTGMG